MNVPYTTSTGVQIGIRYQEQGVVCEINDPDMLLLQEALLATPSYIREKQRQQLFVYLSACVGAFLLICFLVIKK